MFRFLAITATLTLGISIAAAPSAVAADSGQLQPCGIRFITTDNIQIADSTNFKDGGLVGGLLSGLYRTENPLTAHDAANAAIGPEGQERLITANLTLLPPQLSSDDMAFEFGGQRPLAAFQDARKTSRLSASDAPCLTEISVVAVTYVRTSLARRIGYLFMFRQFDGIDKARRVVTYAGFSPVKAFPPQSDTDLPAAREELSAGFIKTFEGFMEKIRKSLR